MLLQTVVVGTDRHDPGSAIVNAQMVVLAAGFVSLTLCVNAPCIGAVLSGTGLNRVSEPKLAIRRKAWGAVYRYTEAAIHDLQEDRNEARCTSIAFHKL